MLVASGNENKHDYTINNAYEEIFEIYQPYLSARRYADLYCWKRQKTAFLGGNYYPHALTGAQRCILAPQLTRR
jgi:hypothetical protein